MIDNLKRERYLFASLPKQVRFQGDPDFEKEKTIRMIALLILVRTRHPYIFKKFHSHLTVCNKNVLLVVVGAGTSVYRLRCLVTNN